MKPPGDAGVKTDPNMWLRPTQIDESGVIFADFASRKALLRESRRDWFRYGHQMPVV